MLPGYQNAYDLHKEVIGSIGADVFSNPLMSPTATDVIFNGRYLSDDVFVQTRYALFFVLHSEEWKGLCNILQDFKFFVCGF